MVSYRKRSNGWEYRISYKKPDGTYGTIPKGGFKTKAEATIAAAQAEIDLSQGVTIDKNITLYDYFKTWYMVHKLPNISTGTIKHYETAHAAIGKYFSGIKISQIKPTNYQATLNEMGEHYRKSTLKLIHTKIRRCLAYAVADGIIQKNPAELATPTSTVAPRNIDDKFLQLDEYQKLISKTKKSPWEHRNLHLYLLAVTGMRYGESLGLTWDDIDLVNGEISINKTWDIYSDSGFAPTKNEQSIRKIPIDYDTIELLLTYREICKTDRLFTSKASAYLNKRIKALVGRNVHVHSLRHTYVSYLLYCGIEVITVSKLIGHREVTVTLNTYSHLLQAREEKDHERIRTLFNFGQILDKTL